MSQLRAALPKSSTLALFARVSRTSERIIVPIGDETSAESEAKPIFYCVHDVTGAAGAEYIDLARHMGSTARFYGIQAPPNRMSDPEFGESIESVASFYAQAVEEFQPDGPFYLGGFSGGAIVALEMAQRLRHAGREVALLVAVDAAPENVPPERRGWHPDYLLKVARNFPAWIRHGGFRRQKNSHSLGKRIGNNLLKVGKGLVGLKLDEKWSGGRSIDDLMNLERYPPPQRSFINRLYSAYFDYVAAPYPDPVVAYEAQVRPLLKWPQFGRRWLKIAPATEIVEMPGTHIELLREPYVVGLAEDLCQRIAARHGAYRPPTG
jgi:thioesterase domain-containing protein